MQFSLSTAALVLFTIGCLAATIPAERRDDYYDTQNYGCTLSTNTCGVGYADGTVGHIPCDPAAKCTKDKSVCTVHYTPATKLDPSNPNGAVAGVQGVGLGFANCV